MILTTGLAFTLVIYLFFLPVLPHEKGPAAPSTRLLDRNGALLYEWIDPEGGTHIPIGLEQVPKACQQATIATEDQRFYLHPGIDILAIARALWANSQSEIELQGASTLTQQLVRILLFSPAERFDRSLQRKVREAWLAVRLEAQMGKDEILTLYLNHVYYGHFANGIEAAAHAYFGKNAAALDLAECALLAGLPQSPATYNPIEHPQAARDRQQQVLNLMVQAGYIDLEQARAAHREPLHYAATPFPIAAPHFVFLVQDQLERALGQERIRQGGLVVTTTLDVNLQRQAEALVRRHLVQLNAQVPGLPIGHRAKNAALVALDPGSGSLLSLVGSPDYFNQEIAGAVNGALALRQPGSAMKPLTYAIALDPGLSAAAHRQPLTPASILADVPSTFLTAEGELYRPLNYDLTFHGPVTVRSALANSYNIPAVRVMAQIGVESFINQARRHGITTLTTPEKYGLALTLGGGEVNLLQLTTAYAPFLRAGKPLQPIAITQIEDQDGVLIFQTNLRGRVFNPHDLSLPVPRSWPPVLDARTAYVITDILSDNDARSQAFGLNSPLQLGRPAAAKTGTSTDWRDNWTIGFVPSLLAGVWVGNYDNQPMIGVSAIDGAAPIWHDFMNTALKSTPVQSFPRPDGLVERQVCSSSGLLPGENCPQLMRSLFISGTEPTQGDTRYHRIAIDRRTGLAAGSDTPSADVVTRLAWEAPPEFRNWARDQGYLLWEPRSASGMSLEPASSPTHDSLLLSGIEQGATYERDPRLPLEMQQLRLDISFEGETPFRYVDYLLDGEPIARKGGWPWTLWISPLPGWHEAQALGVDAEGNITESQIVRFQVVKEDSG